MLKIDIDNLLALSDIRLYRIFDEEPKQVRKKLEGLLYKGYTKLDIKETQFVEAKKPKK